MADIIVGDIGTPIVVTLVNAITGVPMDLTTAATTELIFIRPDGTRMVKAADNIGQGRLRWTTVLGDINQAGRYSVRGHVAGPGYDRSTEQVNFTAGG